MADVDINLQIKIDKLRAELEKIPGITSAESKKMAMIWSAEYRNVERAAARASANQAREAERAAHAAEVAALKEAAEREKAEERKRRAQQKTVEDALRGAERSAGAWRGAGRKLAEVAGGPVSQFGGIALDLSESLGALGGTAGIAAGAIAAVGVGAVAAAVGITSAFRATAEWLLTLPETIKELERWEGIEPVTDREVSAINEFASSAGEAGAQVKRLAIELGAEVAPAMTKFSDLIVIISRELVGAVDDIRAWSQYITGWMLDLNGSAGLARRAILYLIDAMPVLSDRAREVSESISGIDDTVKQTDEHMRELAASLGFGDVDLGAPTRAATSEQSALVKAQEAARDARRKAHEEAVAQANERARLAPLAARIETEALQSALAEQTEARLAAEEVYREQKADTLEHIQELEAEYDRQRRDAINLLAEEAYNTAVTVATELAAMRVDDVGKEIKARKDAHRETVRQLQTQRDIVEEQLASGKISAAEARDRLAAIDAEHKTIRKNNAANRQEQADALRSAFKAQKTIAVGRAIAESAISLIALTTAFAYLGPGAPFAAAGIAGPMLALQLAAIRKQEAPSFDTGGMVGARVDGAPADHVTISASRAEGILTERGVQGVGGPEGLAALNRGQPLPGALGGSGAAVYLDGNVMGSVVMQVVRTDPAVLRAIANRAGVVPGRRARYGGRG